MFVWYMLNLEDFFETNNLNNATQILILTNTILHMDCRHRVCLSLLYPYHCYTDHRQGNMQTSKLQRNQIVYLSHPLGNGLIEMQH